MPSGPQDHIAARNDRVRSSAAFVGQPGHRATQHYAVADFGTEYREMRRITVAGDVPVSIDGRHSRVLRGDATAYSRIDELIS